MTKATTTETLESVAIRFAGDSGDGMQLTGGQFTATTALAGNDLATFPDFPAEIRAPAGSLFGVSGFQINFSGKEVFTPGDAADVLVAMNPAALKTNLADLKRGGILILNTEAFSDRNLNLAKYDANPLEDQSLDAYRVFAVNITGMAEGAVAELGLSKKDASRTKNFFALGIIYWMFNRRLDHTEQWIHDKFDKRDPKIAEANIKALRAGYYYGETAEAFQHNYIVAKAELEPGRYRNITGNEALSLGFLAAAELSGLGLFLGSYPITPASDILHFLSRHKNLGVRTFQAEDEIAAVCAALGAAYSGAIGLTTTSGPGLALKSEAMNLALMLELPLVVVNVQRGGPSTGLPTKTEQSDLLQALYGRNGESPIPVVAPASPGDCFHAAIDAVRIAIESMTPVLLLSDGYLANGAAPWKIPQVADIPKIDVKFRTNPEGFQPYQRDANLARPWAIPGTPGLEHRVGGLEKEDVTGNVSYDPQNHQRMTEIRAEKVAKIAERLPPTDVYGDDSGLVVVGWGGTYGAIRAGVEMARDQGHAVAHVHVRHLNPFPRDLDNVLARYRRVLVPELNMGQLAMLLRARADGHKIVQYNKVQGRPFGENEMLEVILQHVKEM
ncbi:MAG: 2-oxoacid:acceptor oxidoreductase subunit alpha [Myxococcota bacterium]